MTDSEALAFLVKCRRRRIDDVRKYMKEARRYRIARWIVREDLADTRLEIAAFGRAIRALGGKP